MRVTMLRSLVFLSFSSGSTHTHKHTPRLPNLAWGALFVLHDFYDLTTREREGVGRGLGLEIQNIRKQNCFHKYVHQMHISIPNNWWELHLACCIQQFFCLVPVFYTTPSFGLSFSKPQNDIMAIFDKIRDSRRASERDGMRPALARLRQPAVPAAIWLFPPSPSSKKRLTHANGPSGSLISWHIISLTHSLAVAQGGWHRMHIRGH